tara:strand:- start:144 stop:347 length:204 start_codon:yes stop_codon:yes gene_type:complete
MGLDIMQEVDMTINTVLFVVGVILVTATLVALVIKDIPAGTKGITKEYTSKSGVKRTAKKEREDYIV